MIMIIYVALNALLTFLALIVEKSIGVDGIPSKPRTRKVMEETPLVSSRTVAVTGTEL